MDVIEYVKATLWLIGTLSAVAAGYENIYVKPKERRRKEELEKIESFRQSERRELVSIRRKEHEALMVSIEEAFRPHTEKLAETEKRVDVIEVKTEDHDQRIFVLERENGIGDFKYVERFTGKEKE